MMGNIGSNGRRNRGRRGRQSNRPRVQSPESSQIPTNVHRSHVAAEGGDPAEQRWQKAVTVRNDVHVQKETLRVEADEENPGRFLVCFTFNATVDGSITILFFAKEEESCTLTPTKEGLREPVTVSFQQGLGQKFRQPPGTGIELSLFEDKELLEVGGEGDMELYPLAVKADAFSLDHNGSEEEKPMNGIATSQMLLAVFEREKGEYRVRVQNQILCINDTKYKLQEIYGIGNSVEGDSDENQGKECVICLSEPRDTTVLPCRHMCMCNGCARHLKLQRHQCPICRQPVEQLLEIEVSNSTDE